MWHLKYGGPTLVPTWDDLSCQACSVSGWPLVDFSKYGPLEERLLDEIASSKGWRKHNAHPAMTAYYNNSIRLNFYLSTGTVEALCDRSGSHRTQLFRCKVKNVTGVFDNPHQDSDGGTVGQKRKSTEEMGRTCAQCGQTKSTECFSRNQRRKRSTARCKTCVR